MATLSIAPIILHTVEGDGLGAVPIHHQPEDASETFKQGALLVFNASNGRIAECGADPTFVEGVALHLASGTTGRDVTFIKNAQGLKFEATLENAGSPGHALVQTNLGVSYGAYKDGSTGYWAVDVGETSTLVFRVVGFISAIGDIRPRVIVEFAQASQG